MPVEASAERRKSQMMDSALMKKMFEAWECDGVLNKANLADEIPCI